MQSRATDSGRDPRLGWILLLALGLSVPTLFHGFIVDDHLILALIEERYPEKSNAFGIYSSLIEQIDLPWWVSAEMESSFFRPVSAALFRLDHALFGHRAVFWHLHSLAWLALLVFGVARLYRSVPRTVGLWALILFALEEAHGFTAGWISNRHALVSATLGVGALLAHRAYRRSGRRAHAVAAAVAYVLALGGGEVGLAFLGYGFCFELFRRSGSESSGSESSEDPTVVRRLQRAAPMVLLLVAYAAVYKLLGYGTSGGRGYLDPASEPLRYLAAAIERVPILLGALLGAVPADISAVPGLTPPLVVAGVVLFLVAAFATLRLWSGWDESLRRELPWLLGGAALSLLPLAATIPSSRQLLAPMIGVAPLLAAFLVSAWRAAKRRSATLVPIAALLFLGFAHLLVAPFFRLVMPENLRNTDQGLISVIDEIPPTDRPVDVLVVRSPDWPTTGYLRTLWDARRQHPVREITQLVAAPVDLRVKRVAERVVEIEVVGEGEMLTSFLEQIWLPSEPFRRGEILHGDGLEVEVLEMGDEGPRALRFTFDESIERDDLLTLAWIESRMQRFRWPAVGESVEIADSPGRISYSGLEE